MHVYIVPIDVEVKSWTLYFQVIKVQSVKGPDVTDNR